MSEQSCVWVKQNTKKEASSKKRIENISNSNEQGEMRLGEIRKGRQTSSQPFQNKFKVF